MGRIVMFTVDDCVHCTRLQRALEDQSIPFEEVSLSLFPERRKDMLSMSDRLTVPQVFFNEKHIGGADDTFAVLSRWFTDTAKTALEHYQQDVGDLPDPTEPRLAARSDRLTAAGTDFVIKPYIRFKGLPGEQATMFFFDPAGNALEFKAFKDDAQIFATE